jgi:hypothetical protein
MGGKKRETVSMLLPMHASTFPRILKQIGMMTDQNILNIYWILSGLSIKWKVM